MTWETLYNRYMGWAAPTLRRNLASLENYGPADQVVEVAYELDSNADRFIKAALRAGVDFSVDDLLGLEGVVKSSTIEKIIDAKLRADCAFTVDDVLSLDGLVGGSTLSAMVSGILKQGIRLREDQIDALEGIVDAPTLKKAQRISGIRENGDAQAPQRHGPFAEWFQSRRQKRDDFRIAWALYDMTREEDRRRKTGPVFHVGDMVRVGDHEGCIIDRNDELYTVRCGHRLETVSAFDMRKIW